MGLAPMAFQRGSPVCPPLCSHVKCAQVIKWSREVGNSDVACRLSHPKAIARVLARAASGRAARSRGPHADNIFNADAVEKAIRDSKDKELIGMFRSAAPLS